MNEVIKESSYALCDDNFWWLSNKEEKLNCAMIHIYIGLILRWQLPLYCFGV